MDVLICMDECWRWWPVDRQNPGVYDSFLKHSGDEPNKITIPQELYDEYQRAYEATRIVQDKLEHLYRHQQGYEPFLESPFHPDNITEGDSNV